MKDPNQKRGIFRAAHTVTMFDPYQLLTWIERHSGLAAWVQAVGAILALAVAIFVPVRIARNRERLNRRRFLESVAAIGNEVRECFVIAATKCGDQTSGERFVRSVDALHRFRIASAAITAIPVHQLPSYALTQSVLALQRLMSEALVQLEAAFNEVGTHGNLVQYKDFASAFNNLAAQADDPVTRLVDSARNV